MRVRQSTLKQFGKCAKQYEYAQVLQLGGDTVGSLTVLGTVFHFAVDVYETYNYDIDLAKRTFIFYWDHPEVLGEKIDFYHRRTSHDGLRKRGLAMLDRYHELAPWTKGKVLGTEIHFVVPIGDHELEGTIDKLWYRPGQRKIEVIDFKTGSFVPAKLSFNIQFSAYCYATERPEFWQFVKGWEHGYVEFKGWQRQGWWYHARNHKMFNAGGRDVVDYKRLLLAIEEMDKALKANVYPLDYSGESCGWCPYADGTCGSAMVDPTEVAKEKVVLTPGT